MTHPHVDSEADAQSPERTLIAQKIRETRKARNLSTREVGRRAGMSSGMISMIENHRTGVSLEGLRKIAGALDVPVVQFLTEPESEPAAPPSKGGQSGLGKPQVVHKAERQKLAIPGSGISIEMLTHGVKQSVEFVIIEFDPGVKPKELLAHHGEEYVLVISGTMHLWLDGECYVLEAGDSTVFDSSVPHGVENPGTEKLVQLSAITPPTY